MYVKVDYPPVIDKWHPEVFLFMPGKVHLVRFHQALPINKASAVAGYISGVYTTDVLQILQRLLT